MAEHPLEKLWPHFGRWLQQVVKESGEPLVNNLLASVGLEKISQFKVRHLWLGNVPPRLGGVRVYEKNTHDDEVVMDLDLMYSGNGSLVFSLQSMRCEIKKVSVRSTVRVILRPILSSLPFIGGVEVMLLEMPDFSYNFAGLANVADLPGLNVTIKASLDKVIRQTLVWPNRLSFQFPMDEVVEQNRVPAVQGVLQVDVLRARNLIKADQTIFGGKSDPYVVLTIGETHISFVDDYIENSVNPEWGYHAEFPMEQAIGTSLTLEVWDYDRGQDDDFLGRCHLDLSEDGDEKSRWIRLEGVKKGEVEVKLCCSPTFSSRQPSLRYALTLLIDSCTNVGQGKGVPPNFCLCVASLGAESGGQSQKRSSIKRNLQKTLTRRSSSSEKENARHKFKTSLRPLSALYTASTGYVWREFHFFVGDHLLTDFLLLRVEGSKGSLLGWAELPVTDMESPEQGQIVRLEKKLEACSRPGAKIAIAARILYF